MVSRIRHQLSQEDGIGIILAISVSFIVFSLGLTWFALATHELDEVSFDRNRSQAIAAADGGAKDVMAMLRLNTGGIRDTAITTGFADLGFTGAQCDVSVLNPNAPDQAEYWARVTYLGDEKFEIESWAWSPSRTARQSVVQKVEYDVELIPLGGFREAFFAAGGGYAGANFKEIYGDAYSGTDISTTGNTSVYANEPPYTGTGNLAVYGDLVMLSGSNLSVEGDTDVQGNVWDDGSTVFSNVAIRDDGALSSYSSSYFRNSDVDGEIKTRGVIDPTSNFRGVDPTIVPGATDLTDVRQTDLPTYVFLPGNYPGFASYPTVADFKTSYYNTNWKKLEGVHVIENGGGDTIDFARSVFVDHFMLVINNNGTASGDGSAEIKGKPNGGSTPEGDAASVVIAMTDPLGTLSLRQVSSIPDEVHHLIFSTGAFSASTRVEIYGAIYGEADTSSNYLEVHFRDPAPELTQVGFVFDPRISDEFAVTPGIWNLVDPSDRPITTTCTP